MSFCVLAGGAVDVPPARDVNDATAEGSADEGSSEDAPAADGRREANPRRSHVDML